MISSSIVMDLREGISPFFYALVIS
ncbi:Protein of unknown function [Bacillus mycoides]|uniref:Uncharacterized protein n=1 Tax=Bacillus mycoides TaxID=1405 RepID=A0A1C3ZLH5_BACMY|nr:Protein of unknown function [Bacillus mycoides]SCB83239.1 Protein of unknown function [Bacillus mycoides]